CTKTVRVSYHNLSTPEEMQMKRHFFSTLTAIIISASQLFAVENSEKAAYLAQHIQNSIQLASAHKSRLAPGILALEGMSSTKVRSLLNNLCSLPDASYLEIGVWKGSTFVSALYGNEGSLRQAVAIDDWSEFGGPAAQFQQNCKTFLKRVPHRFYSADSFKINPNDVVDRPINIYFYDGAHDALSQELALTHYYDVCDDLFILIVDDWNYPPAQEGTRNAMQKLNCEVLYEISLPANYNGDKDNWWNGLYVALISKN
ncbi:MAG: class I SAM-dependent methyltransferase, partial [Chlamydiota bacterium]